MLKSVSRVVATFLRPQLRRRSTGLWFRWPTEEGHFVVRPAHDMFVNRLLR
jgi:hypothetical protein